MRRDDHDKGVRRRIFLLCSRRPIVGEFLLLAEAISRETDLETVLVVADGLAGMLPEALPDRCTVVFTGPQTWKSVRRGSLAYSVFGAIRVFSRVMRSARLANLSDFVDTWEAVARGRWMAKRILRIENGGIAVLTADDRDLRLNQGFLRVARDLGMFTMVVAFGKSDPEADALRRDNAIHDIDLSPLKRMKQAIARAYPEGVRLARNGRRLLFFRPGDYWALRAHGALFPVPWSYGGGLADKVAVFDGAAAELLKGMGVAIGKILVAGQCSHDVLWSTLEQRADIRRLLDSKYQLDPERPLVILAMPVLGEHGMSSPEQQQGEAESLLETLRMTGANVLVSLHPRQDASSYRAMISRYGLALAQEPLRDILAAGDLFVAYSTTIAWAQLLGVPSVALEYYDLGYTLFQDQPGVVAVTSRADLASACASILHSPDVRRELAVQMKDVESRETFDGNVRKRLISEILDRSGGNT